MEPRAAAAVRNRTRHLTLADAIVSAYDALPRNRGELTSPLRRSAFLERSALIWPDKIAVRHGRLSYTYREIGARCRRLASALARARHRRGDTVAIMAPNVPALLEAHYAVPALGAILNPLNVRLDARHDRVLPRARRREGR